MEEPDDARLVDDTVKRRSVTTFMKWLLTVTGQRCPYDWSIKKIVYILYQLALCVLVTLYFVHAMDFLWSSEQSSKSKKFFYRYPITTLGRAIWEFRWCITLIIGVGTSLFLSRKWRDSFLENKEIPLSFSGWKKVQSFMNFLVGVLVVVILGSVVCSFLEVSRGFQYGLQCHDVLYCSLNALLLLLDRLFTIPLFFVCCVAIYNLGTMVEEYKVAIQEWPAGNDDTPQEGQDDSCAKAENVIELTPGEDGARKRFRLVKKHIRSTEHLFQTYLAVHFFLLFLSVILGVCSCFEQMEVRISENVTMVSPLLAPRFGKMAVNVAGGNMSVDSGIDVSFLQIGEAKAEKGEQSTNTTLGHNSADQLFKTKWFERSANVIFIDMFIKTFESLFFYLSLVWLMLRLENQLRHVVEAIEDSDCEYQKENKFLFSDVCKIRSMCKYVKTASGLKIFGCKVPTFITFILAAFGPFGVVIMQRLLSYIHMEK